jgi:hypothetical protein
VDGSTKLGHLLATAEPRGETGGANHIRTAELILRQVMQTTRNIKGHFKVGMAWSRTAQAKQELDRLLDSMKEQP